MAGTAVTSKLVNEMNMEAVALREEHNKITYRTSATVAGDLETLRKTISEFSASTTWDAGAIADGNFESKDITVTGAALGDYAWATITVDLVDMAICAAVTLADTVTATIMNQDSAGANIDLASATCYVRCASPGLMNLATDLTAATVNA